jgi:hypothetical protein
VIAAWSALFALYAFLRIWTDAEARSPWFFIVAGFFAAFTACVELPAAALTAGMALLLFWRFPGRTLAFFLPAAALPIAAFFLTNYLAIGEWTPAYSNFGGPWYQFEGSAWRRVEGEEKHGIDWAHLRESREEYALHFLVGHHGLFSLTPIYLFAFAGMIAGLVRWERNSKGFYSQSAAPEGTEKLPPVVCLLTLCLSVVVIGFYLWRTTNYGGWTNGLRWLMWLTPFWLLTMLPVADHLSRCCWGRTLGYVFLALSVLSVNYWAWNPWRHPWLYHWFQELGWPGY